MALLTQKEFKAKFPTGNYRKYLKYVAAKGGPEMKAAAKAKLSGKTGSAISGPWISQPYLTTEQMFDQASTWADGQLLPNQQAIQREIERQKEMAAAQAAATQGYSQAVMPILQSIAPQVQGAYQNAAGLQAGLAQGFAGDIRNTANAEAAAQSEILRRQGAPGAQIQQVQGQTGDSGTGDVLYGTQGYIPGTSLGAQGAAWASQAAGLPGVMAATTRDNLQAQSYQAGQNQRELSQQLLDLEAQRPGLIQQMLNALQQNELSRFGAIEASNLARDRFGLDTLATIDPTTGLPYVDPPDPGDVPPSRQEKRNDAKDAFRTTLRKEAEDLGLITTKTVVVRPATATLPEVTEEREVKLPYFKAVKKIRAFFAAEIDQMKRLGVKPSVIENMIRNYLLSIEIVPPTTVAGLNPVGGPGGTPYLPPPPPSQPAGPYGPPYT